MPQITSLIRTYTSQGAYEQDATRLARLGYVVASVVEEPGQWRLSKCNTHSSSPLTVT